MGDDLPKLLGARLGQARDPLRQLPVLMTDKLTTDDELRRAHLLLCLFAHAYVWGGNEPMDHIPEGIAKPLWEVSQRLGIPPILGHPSIVLYNWRRLDIDADISMENLTTLNNFFDGLDESWYVYVYKHIIELISLLPPENVFFLFVFYVDVFVLVIIFVILCMLKSVLTFR